jgi:parallel beta-helix repeat protein
VVEYSLIEGYGEFIHKLYLMGRLLFSRGEEKLFGRTVSGIMFTLFLMGTSTLTISVKPVNAYGFIYIKADGSVDPPTAGIFRSDYVTYTFAGDIYDFTVVVERDNITIDGKGHKLWGFNKYGIMLSERRYVTIKNIRVVGFDFGIYLSGSLSNTVSGNIVFANDESGIRLNNSSNNNISGNNLPNSGEGILFDNSSCNNIVCGNSIVDNGEGIRLYDSSNNNTISGNNISDAHVGIGLYSSPRNTIKRNNVRSINGVYLSGSSGNTVNENNLTYNNNCGIRLHSSSNNNIHGNNVTYSGYGVWLSDSSNNNTVNENSATNNNGGIKLHSSSSNTVNGNTVIANKYFGIDLDDSSNSTIGGNILVNEGLHVANSYGNVVVDNLVNGEPLVYLESVSNLTVDNDAGQVILVNCDGMLVKDLNLSYTDVGIQLWKTSNTRIINNSIKNSRCGIELQLSSNNNIQRNRITANKYYGILFYDSSNNNTVNENNVTNNSDCGIRIWSSSDNTLSGNHVIANNSYGVKLEFSSNNTISRSNITNNGYGFWLSCSLNTNISDNNITSNDFGIYIYSSSCTNTICKNNITNNDDGIRFVWLSNNNTVRGNNITNNIGGIRFYSSSNNKIYNNNFLNNTTQVDSYNLINIWDNGYPSGGNYWYDYTGADLNRDGIGDIPYVIDSDNVDHYPLMTPYRAPLPQTYSLTITTTAGGTTNPILGTYSHTAYSTVRVTAIPNANYLFNHWELNSVNAGSANPYTILMDTNYTLKAVFSPIQPPPKPVGGYSLQIEGYPTTQPITLYLTLIAILTIGFATIRRRTTKKQNNHRLLS